MSGVLSLTTLLVMFAASEALSRRTHAIINTVLTLSILSLAGFWTGILPKTLFTASGVEGFGMTIVGLMLTALGTTINIAELKQEWKVVVIAINGAIGASILIILIALAFGKRDYGIVGAPIFAGGNAATLVLLAAIRSHHLQLLATFALAVLTFQNLIGIPVTTFALRREAHRFLKAGTTLEPVKVKYDTSRGKPLQLPEQYNTAVMCLAKLGLVASISYVLSILINGTINYLVICFILGIVFYQLGFLDDQIMAKSASSGIITFLVTVVILGNLADTTPQQVISVILPLIVCLVTGTIGVILTALILAKPFHISPEMAVALGMTCTFGFPTTMIISQEIAASMGKTPEEQAALETYLLPKMVTAGLVTVTLISVFFAGFAINFLH